MNRGSLQILVLAAFSSSVAMGQINCASGPAQSKLICQFPYSTGAYGGASALGGSGNSQASASSAAVTVATSLNTAMASQVSQLPIASASAGTVVVFRAGVPETFNNLGPILTDRGQTIGKGKVFIGFSASQYVFTDIDKNSLSSLPFGFSRAAYNSNGVLVSTTYTSETINLAFKLNQYVGIATVGLSKRFDVSAIVPWERVSLGDTIINPTSYVVNANNSLAFPPYTSASTYSAGTANGIGDVIFNAKAMLWSGERSGFAGEMNVRTPTGDALNFLGSGAWGFNPFLVYSYLAKVSPHAKIGYEWNTSTVLNNPTGTNGGNEALPGGLVYDVGADYAVLKRMTLAGDLLGSQFLNTPGISPTKVPITTTNSQPVSLSTSTPVTSSYTVNNFSGGLKVSPVGSLVLAGNVLIQLNNNGLHARPTPLVGISYKF
jgi:hypothetical protein